MPKDFLQLPRSVLSDELWRNKDYGCLLWFLLLRADNQGVATFTATDIEMRLGISRQRLRTMLGKIQKSGLATSIQPTTNQQATNIAFDFQRINIVEQPTTNQLPTNKTNTKAREIHPSHRRRSRRLCRGKRLPLQPRRVRSFLSNARMENERRRADERLESRMPVLGNKLETKTWRTILLRNSTDSGA